MERVRTQKVFGVNLDRWIQCDEDAELCSLKGRFSRTKLDCFLFNPLTSKQGILEQYNLFSSSQRNFLLHGLITRVKIVDLKGQRRDLDALVEGGVYTHYFTLHDGSALDQTSNLRATLYMTWRGWLRYQPIHDIRAYFGERIAFHFAWLGHYTYWLLVSGFFGLIVFFYGFATALATPKSSYVIYSTIFGIGLAKTHDYSQPPNIDAYTFSLIFDNVLTLPFAFFMSVWGMILCLVCLVG